MDIQDSGVDNFVSCDVPDEKSSGIKVTIKGNNNRVEIGKSLRISTLAISIEGDCASVRIGDNVRFGSLRLTVYGGSDVSISDYTTVEQAYMLARDCACISIGRDCMVSFNVIIRTSDAHGIYDVSSGDLINRSKDISISDHTWIGQSTIVAKGSVVGKNCVVGAMSFLSNKKFGNGQIIAGTPARIVRTDITWDRKVCENVYKGEVDRKFHLWNEIPGESG